MASATVGPTPSSTQSNNRLSLESIPTVDLRLLTQSDLTALSLCSTHAFDLRRCDDVVIPKIDRSVFNESAGSRKQTYSRLRLARNNPNKPRSHHTTDIPPVLDSERAENSRIISLFKSLFARNVNNSNGNDCHAVYNNNNNNGSERGFVEDELALVPVNVAYCDTLPVSSSVALQNAVGGGGGGGGDGSRKRKRGRKPKSENVDFDDNVLSSSSLVEKYEEEEEEEGVHEVAIMEENNWEDREKEVMNKNGVVLDLEELAKEEDPYGEELRRRTEGKGSAEELLEFVRELEGEWGSRRRKRKIVDANVFGDALPNGWKVLVAIKKKLGRAWVFCRRYISPNGRYFVSCKEISSYLLSLVGPQESKQQPTVVGVDNTLPENNLASENVANIVTQTDCSASIVPLESNDDGSQQMQLCTSHIPDEEKQLTLSKVVVSEEVLPTTALKCHKCSSPFTEKDELLNHLLSCHKRKRRKSSTPIDDDILMKDGKYECQFCNKLFLERNCYFGHVGIHVKNYVKSIGGTPGLTAKRKASDLTPMGEVMVTASDTPLSAEQNTDSVAGTPNDLVSSELNSISTEGKAKASTSAGRHLGNGINDQNDVSLHAMVNVTYEVDKGSAGKFSDEQDETVLAADNNFMEVDEASDPSAVKPDYCSGSDKVLSNNETNDLCESYRNVNATDCVASKVSRSPHVREKANPSLSSDSKQVDRSANSKFVPGNIMESEGLASENSLSVEEMSEGSMGYKTLEHNYDEGLKEADKDQLMDGVQHPGTLKECLAIPNSEEERCGITTNKNEHMGSPVSDSELEGGSETSFFVPSGDQHTIEMENDEEEDFADLVDEAEVDLRSFENSEATIDANKCITQERHSESSMILLSENNGSTYVRNETETASHVEMQRSGDGGFAVEQTCSPKNSMRDVSNRVGEDPEGDRIVNEGNLFFTSGGIDLHLDSSDMTNNEHTDNDVSNTLGAFNSFIEDKQVQAPRSMLSRLSMNEHNREVAIKDVINVSQTSTTMQLSVHDKVESPRSNKLILDFGSMTEMNTGFLSSVQHETVQDEPPFQLWGQQTCGLEENQNKVYGGASGVAQQGRPSNNISLNLVGLQQSSDVDYNLNKVSMSEQRYVQHNESGLFGRNNEVRREDTSHGNTLSLSGFQQQCNAEYNLNKPCISQQSFGVQHTERGAYSTSGEARQERGSYGNSLSLASVQQACDTRYNLNEACVQQTCDPGYSMNKGYMETIQELSKLGDLGHSRDRDLMVGFGNSGGRPNQVATTEFLWRSPEGNILPGGLPDSSSTQGQSSGTFQAFDFLSDKGRNDLYTTNEKFDNMSNYEGLRSTVEPMEFSFMSTQESNAQLQQGKVMQYNPEIDQGFASSVWNQKPTPLPNMMAGHVVSTMCVWCGNEFPQDSLGCEMQAGSIGYLCPTCKARMSGQFL